VIDVSIRHENVALRVPRDIGRPPEEIFLRGRLRARRRRNGARHGLRPVTEHHHDPSGGIELDHHVRSLVDDPDVVLGIDTNTVGELESVVPFPDFPDERAVLIELEQPGVGAARVDEDMPLGIGRDTNRLAQVHAGRELQEGADLMRDFGDVLRFGLVLRNGRAGEQHGDDDEKERQASLHLSSPNDFQASAGLYTQGPAGSIS